MSQRIPDYTLSPSHWSYMAKVMTKVFEEASRKNSLKRDGIPGGVLADATRFSKLVLKPTSDAAAGSRFIAFEAIKRMKPDELTTAIEKMFCGCTLVVCIASREISEVNHPALKPLFLFMSEFFSELSKMGEKERSARFSRNDLKTGDDE